MNSDTVDFGDAFTAAYARTLLWQATDENGKPLDASLTLSDFSPEMVRQVRADCHNFRAMLLGATSGAAEMTAHLDANPEQCAHDFALTRNGHGAGFWDRELGELGDKLTEIAHSFGTTDLYVGDDGRVDSL